MSQIPACVQCGGTEYILESGFYFCAECQVKSQDMREEVFDDYWSGQRTGRVSIAPTQSQEVATQDSVSQQPIVNDKSSTSWEALNIVLKGLIDELILLGASKELKLVVLQLWATYLMKTEVAFISKQIEKRPRLGLNFRKRDAEVIYGTSNELIQIYKRPIFRKKRERESIKSNEENVSSFTNKRIEKYRLTMKKKMLAKAEYERSSVSSQASEITLESLSGRSVSSSHKSFKLRYSKKAKSALTSLLDVASEVDSDVRSSLQKNVLRRDAKSIQHISMLKVLAILRLALLIIDSDIHLSDLLRWSEESYLSLLNAEKLLPSNASFNRDVTKICITTLNSRLNINKAVLDMADFLGVVDISSRILPLIKRFLKELQLPDDLMKIIRMFIELSPPKMRLTYSVNYEGRAMAYIIFALKFLFGLDGVTEKYISHTAKLINRCRKRDDGKRLFSWSEWVRYINCRRSVVSFYHQATRDLYYPSSVVNGSKAFLSHWDKIPTKHTIQRKHDISPNLKDCMRRFLKDFGQEPVEPLPPSLSPLSSTLMELYDRDQFIPERTKKILDQDFCDDTIDYLYNPVVQEKLSTEYEIDVTEVLAAKIVKVKPLTLEGNYAKPSRKGNKQMVKVNVDDPEEEPDRKSTKYKLNMKKGYLPDEDKILGGVKLKESCQLVDEREVLSICGRKYWVYHGGFYNVRQQARIFNYVAEYVFPNDFFWLLKEASVVAHVCPRDLYVQLSYVEKMYLEYITAKRKPRKFFTDHW